MSSTKTCPDCNNVIEESANICDRCGYIFSAQSETRFPAKGSATNALSSPDELLPGLLDEAASRPVGACSACGFINAPGEMFCQNCGIQLPPVRTSPPPLPKQVDWPLPQRDRSGAREDSETLPQEAVRRRLIVVGQGAEIPLSEKTTQFLLGRRDPTLDIYPDVDLTPFDGDQRGISRRHARIIVLPEGTFIEDLNSTNFTFVNRFRLQPGKKYILNDGDQIRLGLLLLEYYI